MNSKSKIVRLEPSPFIKTKIQLKRSQAKTNSSGFAIRDNNGDIVKADVPVEDAVQIPGTSKTIAPVLTSSGLRTGLEKIVDNPYKDEPAYSPAWGEKVLANKEKASLQHILEYKHKQEYNYYSGNYMDRVMSSSEMHTQPFFLTDKCKVKLDGAVMFLNLNNPMDEVRYYMILSHPLVANSYADLDGGKNQTAIYYIVNEDEVVDTKLEKVKRETRAAAALENMNAKEDSVLITMAFCLGLDDKAPTKEKAYKYVHSLYNRSEEDYATFMKFYEMYKDSSRRDVFFANGLVQELINFNVLRTRDNKFYWVMPETEDHPLRTFEWTSKDRLVHDFIIAPEYQDEFDIMKSILESRKQ